MHSATLSEKVGRAARFAAPLGSPRGLPRAANGQRPRKRGGERPESGAVYTERVERECARLGTGRFCTIIGRFWSLDREHNWDRIEKTYRALVAGEDLAVPADA